MLANARASWRDEYPFASQSMELDGHRYHYIDEGQGPHTVLAVHGNPTWSFYYRALAAGLPLKDADAAPSRVIAVDHMGCGLSDKPQHYDYRLAKHRDNLLQLIERLDLQRVTLVAHDWGGAIGLAAAVAQSQRFAAVVLLNTAAFPPPYIPRRISVCRWPVVGTLAMRGANAFSRAAVTMAVNRRPLSQAAAAGLLAPYQNWHDRVAVNAFVKDIPMRKSHPTYRTLETLEQQLSCLSHLPTRFVWGMRDWCFRPECLYRLQEFFPKQQTQELADVGHYVMEEAPDEVLAAVRSVQAEVERTEGAKDDRHAVGDA